ncbi:ABC transporter permease [Actinomadura harenae]|uniref:ABC transporter permease n=1 Tax=Actinomadura harenae TaxID=2483351 RepID=A0A3M2MDY4_9ACTN|nr:ABC transporter permease [Actinomadura harenae]RMI47083.1 ABC transporter permease [Actinomadura harenae]
MTLLDTEAAAGTDPAPSRRGGAWRRLLADRSALAALVLVGLLALAALAAPLLTALEGQDPTTFHSRLLDSARGGVPRGALGGISGDHWLGVEPGTGRDVFARVVHGARVSLGVALAATVLELVIGIAIGLAAGLGGRRLDAVLGRVIEIAIAFPSLLLALALMAIVPQSVPRPVLVALAITAVNWGNIARVTRAQAMSLRSREYVDAARLAGARPLRIALREILPGLATPLMVLAALKVPNNIVNEAGLSFLGAGVRPPTPSWGQMLSTSTTWFQTDPAYVIIPGGLLLVTLLAFSLFADGVRRALDPRSVRV